MRVSLILRFRAMRKLRIRSKPMLATLDGHPQSSRQHGLCFCRMRKSKENIRIEHCTSQECQLADTEITMISKLIARWIHSRITHQDTGKRTNNEKSRQENPSSAA